MVFKTPLVFAGEADGLTSATSGRSLIRLKWSRWRRTGSPRPTRWGLRTLQWRWGLPFSLRLWPRGDMLPQIPAVTPPTRPKQRKRARICESWV